LERKHMQLIEHGVKVKQYIVPWWQFVEMPHGMNIQ